MPQNSWRCFPVRLRAAQAVYKNMNTDQTIVDREVTALTMAVNAVTKVKVDSDKSQLKKAIETADSYLNETDVEFGSFHSGSSEACKGPCTAGL